MKTIPTFLTAALLLFTLSTHAQTVDEVVKKYLDAIGGEAAWKKVNTIMASGGIDANGADIKISFTVVQGKGYRTEYSIMGTNGYSIITPTAGWYFNPGSGQTKAEPMQDEQVKHSQGQLDAQGELVDYKAKGTSVAYLGKEKTEGLECYKLRITLKSGGEETWFISVTDNYLVRSVVKPAGGGAAQEESTYFSDYKKLPAGIVYPMGMKTSNGFIRLTSVEINQPVDEKVFKPAG